MSSTAETGPRTGRAGLLAWCLYDFANSGFPAVITTFVFSAYFAQAVAPTPEQGTFLWSQMQSLTALMIALLSPVLGAVADQTGRRKPWIIALTLICVAATASLWWVKPGGAHIPLALVLVAIGTMGFEFGAVFYNAMLPGLVPKGRIGRLSGWGWGAGYIGGIIVLAIGLVGFVQAETPWFGVGKEEAAHVRAIGPLVALWFLVLALPMFLLTPDAPATGVPMGAAIGRGFAQLRDTIARAREHRPIVLFLIAQMIYVDGLNTMFQFGGIYAAGTFGMSLPEVIQFGILLNVTAGIGAFIFAGIDDRLGARTTILISLAGLVAFGTALLVLESKTLFLIVGALLGIFVGPVQAASRSMMARLAPAHLRNEMFGLLAFSGKATAFLGPLVLGWITLLAGSQRAGMGVIVVFMLAGALLLLLVPSDKPAPGDQSADQNR
jgi:UMF1 family MFS transporter